MYGTYNLCGDCLAGFAGTAAPSNEVLALLRALFPAYRCWKDYVNETVHNNSWSMSMDMFRYILGDMYDECDWEVQALPAHSALGDCYEEMILLDLILQLFA